jgi:serine/threonine protein kinase
LPAIVVEYAQHGTIADLLARSTKLDFKTKHILCLDVARGIGSLHQAGLVHGDVKADNVLICLRGDRKYVAKIADFGFSVVEETETAEVWMGGTTPWKAPEAQGPIAVKNLKYADTVLGQKFEPNSNFSLISYLKRLKNLLF